MDVVDLHQHGRAFAAAAADVHMRAFCMRAYVGPINRNGAIRCCASHGPHIVDRGALPVLNSRRP